MTGDSLYVEDLDVLRAPGFDSTGLQVDEFSPGVNVVHGPNASGKTTVARSLQWILWPDDVTERVSLIGQLRLNGESWHVDVDPAQVEYQRNGEPSNGPNLPPADHRDRYYLALHDLLQDDTRNETFAQRIKRESAGGFDLGEAHDVLGYSDSPSTRGKSVVQTVEKKIEELRDAKQEVRELRKEEQRLSTLHQKLEEAEDARERVGLLDQAIDYAEAKSELEDAERKIQEFPDEVSELDGDEAGRVVEINKEIDQWEDKKAAADKRIEKANKQLDEADLPDEGVSEGTIIQLKEHRDHLKSLEDRKEKLQSDLADAEAQRENVLSDIPLDIEESDLTELEPDVWEEVSDYARDAEQVRAERELQSQVDEWLQGDDRPEADIPTLERGRTALENWLSSPRENDQEADTTAFRIAIISALLLAGAGVLLGLFVHPALFLLDAAALVIAWYGYTASSRGELQSSRKTYRNNFENLGLKTPDSWSESDVRDRLNEIYDDLAAHTLADQRKQKRETLSSDVDELQEKEDSLAEKREALVEKLGVSPDTTDLQILAITKGILRWQEADDRVVGCQKEIETVAGQIEETQQKIYKKLESFGYEDISDASKATASIRDLERRKSDHEEAEREIQQAKDTIDEASTEINELESERRALFSKAEVSTGELEQLKNYCDQVEEYEDAVSERDNAEHLKNNEEADLEDFPGFEPDLKVRELADLRSEKADLEDVAQEYDDILGEINQIETKIDEAKRSNDVEEALAEKGRALNAVADQLEADYETMVGDVLTEHVREATLETSRPKVFQRASDILAKITKGRYELLLDEDGDTFRAYDTVKERGYALDKLSSGSRLQVLLSVRVAFVEQQEQGIQLPLILDETLANSDDERADIIIDSMIELARDGRQVFYFTAQGDEVARWLSALEDVDEIDHVVIDLEGVSDTSGRVDVPSLDELYDRSSPPPKPKGDDHESYGDKLDVPAFDPRKGTGRAHLWYIVDDVDLLRRLLDLGIERWGQLENLLDHTDGQMISDDPENLETARRNGEALEAFVEAWQLGRGKPVDRHALEETSAVSGNFIDEVTELARKHDGDGEAIIESLRAGEVDRFRTGKMDELEQYFEEEGYIEPVETLTPEEIPIRVMKTFQSNGLAHDTAQEKAERLISRLAANSSVKETA